MAWRTVEPVEQSQTCVRYLKNWAVINFTRSNIHYELRENFFLLFESEKERIFKAVSNFELEKAKKVKEISRPIDSEDCYSECFPVYALFQVSEDMRRARLVVSRTSSDYCAEFEFIVSADIRNPAEPLLRINNLYSYLRDWNIDTQTLAKQLGVAYVALADAGGTQTVKPVFKLEKASHEFAIEFPIVSLSVEERDELVKSKSKKKKVQS